jgi:hypothetical protein
MSGWRTLWDTYRACLNRLQVDSSVPRSLSDLLVSIGTFENIIHRSNPVPVGFWPQGNSRQNNLPNDQLIPPFLHRSDPNRLTVGQLQWMDYDLLIPALRPLLLSSGLTEQIVTRMIQNAQHDLYHPAVNLSTCINIVHATRS